MTRHFDHTWVDSSRAPLLLARFPDSPSVAEVTEFCTALERFLGDSNERIGWVTDLSQLHSVGAVQRRVFFESNRRVELRLTQRLVAMAVYAPRPFQHGLVTLFHWFVPPKYPFKVFGDLDDALAWVAGQLPDRGP